MKKKSTKNKYRISKRGSETEGHWYERSEYGNQFSVQYAPPENPYWVVINTHTKRESRIRFDARKDATKYVLKKG